jgi:hypothetical protein
MSATKLHTHTKATLADTMINYYCHEFNYFDLNEIGSCTLLMILKDLCLSVSQYYFQEADYAKDTA